MSKDELIKEIEKIYKNDGNIEELNFSTGNQKRIDRCSLHNQDIEAGLLKTLKNSK